MKKYLFLLPLIYSCVGFGKSNMHNAVDQSDQRVGVENNNPVPVLQPNAQNLLVLLRKDLGKYEYKVPNPRDHFVYSSVLGCVKKLKEWVETSGNFTDPNSVHRFIKVWVDSHKEDIDESYLCAATESDWIELVEVLSTYVNVDGIVKMSNKSATTRITTKRAALHIAVMERNIKATRALIKSLANPNVIGALGTRPLHEATRVVSLELVKVLVEEGRADVNAMNIYPLTPLDEANNQLDKYKDTETEAECREIIKFLKANGAKTKKELE